MPKTYKFKQTQQSEVVEREHNPATHWSTARAHAFEIQQLQAQFAALPTKRKDAERARVANILRAEKRRHPTQHSALWKRAQDVYGIDPELL